MGCTVRLARVRLRNYRNYAHLDLELAPGLNVLVGANAQGKTNLLEAIALLSIPTSPRAEHEADLVGPLFPECRVAGVVDTLRGPTEIEVRIRTQGERSQRQVLVDEQPRRALDLPGFFRSALFWPDDLEIGRRGPDTRRRFLDRLLAQVEPGYAAAIGRYQGALSQRNRLLREVAEGRDPESLLDAWDDSVAREGQPIVESRTRLAADLSPIAAGHHAALADGELLEVRYAPSAADLREALAASRAEDISRGSTSAGPHRDDLKLSVAGREVRRFGSQGQQRTAVISLKLAEADLMLERGGEPPLVLLDDVLSELDSRRRANLLERACRRGQVLITTADSEELPIELRRQARIRWVRAGQVEDPD